ncbi:fungal cellulose binding domain-containing protein [Coprinopsis cinerea AmutBmut pab1-1]|nr:fungal cellulose binding domain-containing protein [Coprinopsis cinerea AmutBmut pab1-1]
MSTVLQTSESWPGLEGVKRLFIFGDSYCSVFKTPTNFSQEISPSADNPFYTPYPGRTYAGEGQPNWVGHFITKYAPGPRYDPSKKKQSKDYKKDPLLVYNYASGGDRVAGVAYQVQKLFLPHVGAKPRWAPWDERNSLFTMFVGINDCASFFYPSGLQQSEGQPNVDPVAARVDQFMELQEELYAAGARNFVFFDLPPIDQSPALASSKDLDPNHISPYQKWNQILLGRLETFKSSHPDATVFLFSTHQVFSDLLQNLEKYGFPTEDRHRKGGSVWVDHLHPTSRVHDIIARSLAEFLNGVGGVGGRDAEESLESEKVKKERSGVSKFFRSASLKMGLGGKDS